MLDTPLSLQQCSSSPTSNLLWSVERVVLPVPAEEKRRTQGQRTGHDRARREVASLTREAKEEGNITVLAHIASRVQREYASLGHEIVHYAEEPFLHLSSILCAQNNHFLPSQVYVYACGWCHVMGVPIAGKLPRVINSEVRSTKVLQFFRCWPNAPIQYLYYISTTTTGL